MSSFQEVIQSFFQEHAATVEGHDVPRPVFEFDEATFPRAISAHLKSKFQRPTSIQVRNLVVVSLPPMNCLSAVASLADGTVGA